LSPVDVASAPPNAPTEAPPVEVRGLVSEFGSYRVHDGIDLVVPRGEVMGVVGGSGTGKTVLLNSIIGLRRPDGGQVRVFGKDPYTSSRTERADIERRWGVLFQNGALFSALTVKENVSAPLFEHTDLPEALVGELADMKIAMAGLPPEAADKFPSELSGGMRKRASLARALALDPELLFLDEPTAGLDPIGGAAFDTLIRQLSENLNLTVFMITHDLDTLYAICDRIAVLADKRVVAVGTTAELERSDHPWIQEYFLGPRGRAARRSTVEAEGVA
jgi:phospholipid/cholesterol/gamma-HCH transport system ATP-binding protein